MNRSKIALVSSSLFAAVAFSSELQSAEQDTKLFITDFEPPGSMFDFDTTVMATAPPTYEFETFLVSGDTAGHGAVHEFDQVISIETAFFDTREIKEINFSREPLWVDSTLLVYTDSSPPGHVVLGSFDSMIMTDMETGAANNTTAGNHTLIGICATSFNNSVSLESEVQAEAESIVLASTQVLANLVRADIELRKLGSSWEFL